MVALFRPRKSLGLVLTDIKWIYKNYEVIFYFTLLLDVASLKKKM